MMNTFFKPSAMALALSLVLASSAARAQPHVVEHGVYTLRASTIPSERLSDQGASQHGIERAGDRGVLNVVVLERRDGQQRTVAARVEASRQNLLGQKEPIEMRAVEENGHVSYLGSFEFGPLRNLRFVVTATPAGSKDVLTIEFEDHFVPKDR